MQIAQRPSSFAFPPTASRKTAAALTPALAAEDARMEALGRLLGPDFVDETMAPIRHLAQAKHSPEVQALAARAGLDLAGFQWPIITERGHPNRFSGLQRVVNRLVQTGLDTPENLALLFGPSAGTERMRALQQEMR